MTQKQTLPEAELQPAPRLCGCFGSAERNGSRE